MRTIKLVIIGDSGVGKTSLRSQYITGRFSTGYRATIGTDFITKTLPYYLNPEESVTLQIWDTAGQERFSSLSTAFFRGADAALLMFDVNRPETLTALMKWWETFKAHAPVSDDEAEEFCCVVVGNKIDLAEDGKVQGEPNGTAHKRVSEAEAEGFLEELVPRTSISDVDEVDEYDNEGSDLDDPLVTNGTSDHSRQSTGFFIRPISGFSLHSVTSGRESEDAPPSDNSHNRGTTSPPRTRSQSISIQASAGSDVSFRQIQKVRSSETSGSFLGGTMTTMRTSQTIYHTPSSSIFDQFESAPSTPFYSVNSLSPSPSPGSVEHVEPVSAGPANSFNVRLPRRTSTSSTSSSSAPTITPSLFMRTQASAAPTPPTPIESSSSSSSFPFSSTNTNSALRQRRRRKYSNPPLPPRPERRPRLFLTSAKTGEGVSSVFEHVARRVCMSWTYAEALESRAAALGLDREASGSGGTTTLRLGHSNGSAESGLVKLRERLKLASGCCGS